MTAVQTGGDAAVRVLAMVHCYPPAVGGVELAMAGLCEHLVRDGRFDVRVLTTDRVTITGFTDGSQPRVPTPPDEVREGVAIDRCPVTTRYAPFLRIAQSAAWRLRLPGEDRLRTLYSGPISPPMRRLARELPADVICASSFPLNHMRYAFARRDPAVPVVLIPQIHTEDRWNFDRRCLIDLVARSYATVARTSAERDWLLAKGVPDERVRVIPHGIDEDGPAPRRGAFRAAHAIPRDALLAGYVGQQGAHKGLDSLLAAFVGLAGRHPDAFLAIGGARTSYSGELEQRAAALPDGARERVVIVSDLSRQEKADLLGDLDVFASPSRAESFGLTTLEAWSAGTPVILGDTPSQREVAGDGEAGLLVPYGDSAALQAALERLAGDPELRASLAAAGAQRLRERYRLRDVRAAEAELLAEAAAGAPAHAHAPA